MDISQIEKLSETVWRIPAVKPMRVPALIYGGESLVRDMDEKVAEQLRNVAALPGIVRAAYAMPDAHGFRSSPQTPKAGDGHARLGQSLPGSSGSYEDFRQRGCQRLRLEEGGMRCFNSLRIEGAGSPGRSEFMREMAAAAEAGGWALPDRELAYAPIKSDLGQRYLGAMRYAINCARGARHYCEKPVAARRCRGSAGSLQGCRRSR